MKKILLISIAFPPKSDPESLQVGRYVKYLTADGLDIDVITSAIPTLYMELDDDLNYLRDGVHQITEKYIFENRYLNYLFRTFAPSLLEYPDPKYSFSFFSNKVKRPDLIYSRSYPLSSTILALKIKKQFPDVPWVLHLSDPWALSYTGSSPATSFRKAPRKWNQHKEQESFKFADLITFTSIKTVELYSRHYPQFADKMDLTPNVFDDANVNETPVLFGMKLRILYTGGFGEKRSPLFLLNAISEWLLENPEKASKIEFEFTGPMTRKNANIFEQFSLSSAINHLGTLAYNEMIHKQHSAHILINIDSDISDPNHAVFFPSKLLEYMAAKRRILAITNSYSTTASVVDAHFGDVVEFNDKIKLKLLLSRYLQAFEERNEEFFTLTNAIEQYAAKKNAIELKSKFDDLLS